MRNVIVNGVKYHLLSCGFSEANSAIQSEKAWDFFQKKVCNSKDAFKDCCDYAGGCAMISEPNIKYKQPKAQSRARTKKPQEAFKFGE